MLEAYSSQGKMPFELGYEVAVVITVTWTIYKMDITIILQRLTMSGFYRRPSNYLWVSLHQGGGLHVKPMCKGSY